MAYSLEARVPYLDHRFFEFCARLDPALKQRGTTGKYLLKRLAREAAARARSCTGASRVSCRRWRDWLAGPLRERAQAAFASLGRRGLFRPGALSGVVEEFYTGGRRHGNRLWALLVLETLVPALRTRPRALPMCGIGGFFAHRPIPAAMVGAMQARCGRAVRTPSTPQAISNNGLVHARLSIIDPRPVADQPMANDAATSGSSTTARSTTGSRDAPRCAPRAPSSAPAPTPSSSCAATRPGASSGLLARLRGMFAFAIVDFATGKAFIVRDRMGEKPLVYAASTASSRSARPCARCCRSCRASSAFCRRTGSTRISRIATSRRRARSSSTSSGWRTATTSSSTSHSRRLESAAIGAGARERIVARCAGRIGAHAHHRRSPARPVPLRRHRFHRRRKPPRARSS